MTNKEKEGTIAVMINFKITKKSKKSNARLGELTTSHGVVQTPALVTVATLANVKTLSPDEAMAAKTPLVICNTFHLHARPGEDVVKKGGGLHEFMQWPKPIMTDSGGFQVFSLGFGRDLGTNKIPSKKIDEVRAGQQPRLLKIERDGVTFTSPIDGKKVFLGPKESIRIQEKLGADIILAFDECPPPAADYEYNKKSLDLTHRWAQMCLDAKKSKQALYGIVQGSRFKDLRVESAKKIGSMPFDGFAIGGEFGGDKKTMSQMLRWTLDELPDEKPRHLLGIGHPEDIPEIIKQGVDTFDCIVPTHYARHGAAFVTEGRLDLTKPIFLRDQKPLDKACECYVCQKYTRSYLCHLVRAKEITGLKFLTFHNLFFFNTLVENYRKQIAAGKM